MWQLSVLGFLLVATSLREASGAGLPAEIEKCPLRDAKCLVNRINDVFEKHPHGYPELSVPDLNPLSLNTFEIKEDASKSVNINMKMANMKFLNFNEIRFVNATGLEKEDFNNTVFTLWSGSPKLLIQSQYTISGKILVLPIEGSGDLEATMTNPTFGLKLKVITHKGDDGKTYVHIDKAKVKSEVEGGVTIHLQNLFNGDKTLGDNLNKVINENYKVLWDEIGPHFDRAVSETIQNAMNSFLKNHPIEDVFLL